VVAALGFEVVTTPARREALLASPEIARRLVSVPIKIHDQQTHFLQSPDGPAVIAKRGLRDYWLLAPSLERADPHVHRLIDWVFYTTDATSLWFDTQNELGLELGADFRRNSSKLTRDNGKDSLQLFRTWRLSVEARLGRHEPIRVEGGRVRRALQKAGAVLDHVRNKNRLERRLGFLSLCAAGGQLAKAIVAYDEFASLNGLRTIRLHTVHLLGSLPVIEYEIFDHRIMDEIFQSSQSLN